MLEIDFKNLIEAPIDYVKEKPDVSATRNYSGAKKMFFRSLIYRTIRLTLQYPEEAKEYLDSFPKIGGDNIPTPSEN
jgi:hypothetical protein